MWPPALLGSGTGRVSLPLAGGEGGSDCSYAAAGEFFGASSASDLCKFFVFFDDGVAHVRQVRYLRQRVY